MAYDFRVASDLTTQPKFLLIRARLGDAALWSIMALWGFTTEHRPDGKLTGMSDQAIELAANWTGKPGAFIAACVDKQIRLLEGRPGCRKVHDWEVHNPYVAARESRVNGGKKGGMLAASKLTSSQRTIRAKNANSFRNLSKVVSKVPSKVLSNSHPIPSHPIRGQGSKEPLPCDPGTGMHTCTREGRDEAHAAVCQVQETPTPPETYEAWRARTAPQPKRPEPEPLPEQDRAEALFARLRESALAAPMFGSMSVVGIDGDRLVVHAATSDDAVTFVRQHKGFTLDLHEYTQAIDSAITHLEVR